MKQIIIDLSDPKTEAIEITEPTEIFGVFVGTGKASVQKTISIVHNEPNSRSLILMKAVLFDHSNFDFRGDLVINSGAKQTDTYLRADVLLMSENASATAVPALEITETDVKGGHGATVGMIDRDQLYLLNTRGIPSEEAEKTLAAAFLTDILKKVDDSTANRELIKEQLAKLT